MYAINGGEGMRPFGDGDEVAVDYPDTVLTYRDGEQLSVGSFLSRVLRRDDVLPPVVGAKRAEAIKVASGDVREDVLHELLASHPDRAWAKQFARDRCVVTKPDDSGLFVTDRISGLSDEPLASLDNTVPEMPVFRDARVYSLEQFFSDVDVVSKFPLTDRFLQTVKRCAVLKPRTAAEMVQAHLRGQGYAGVTVVAGKYIKSKKRAVDAIKAATAKLRERDLGVWSQTVADKIFYYHDNLDGSLLWTVEGPLRYASEVKAVYDMCMAVGIEEAIQLLALETALLSIEVKNEVSGMYVSGVIEMHADADGIEPSGDLIVPGLAVEKSAALLAMTDRVVPVKVEDRTVASAVRVTERYALVSNHVFTEVQDPFQIRLSGGPVQQNKLIGNDLWVVSADGPMKQAWHLRDAHIGEKVVYLYSVGPSLEVTSPATVTAADGVDIATTVPPQLRKGVSGAAVVALSDFSLLGVYRGKAGTRAVATVFGSEKYGELTDIELLSIAASQDNNDADNVVARFARKGYSAAFRAACDAVLPLYNDALCVGFAVCYGGHAVTPLDPDMMTLRVKGNTGRAPVFELTGDGRFYADVASSEASSVNVQAQPAVGQRVVICGKDASGVYLSEVCTIRQVGAGARRFYIDPPEYSPDMPMTGGLVMSFDNATVIGQYTGKMSDSYGSRGVCLSSYEPVERHGRVAQGSVKAALGIKFPMLSLVAWDGDAVERVFDSNDGARLRSARAIVGKSILQVVAVREMEKAQVKQDHWWALMAQYGSLSALQASASRHGLTDLIRYDNSVELPAVDNIVEALVGLAFLHEDWSVVTELCYALGLVPREVDELSTPTVASFFHSKARDSHVAAFKTAIKFGALDGTARSGAGTPDVESRSNGSRDGDCVSPSLADDGKSDADMSRRPSVVTAMDKLVDAWAT